MGERESIQGESFSVEMSATYAMSNQPATKQLVRIANDKRNIWPRTCTEEVRDRYQKRAQEYCELLGAIDSTAIEDRQMIACWADAISGPIVDVGSGPGHWTDFLHRRGVDIEGIELAPEFVDSAKTNFPHVHFQVGDFCALPVEDGALGGILSWYSVIHTNPVEIPTVLDEFARALRPGGSLLIGFFHGEKIQLFDHAIAPA